MATDPAGSTLVEDPGRAWQPQGDDDDAPRELAGETGPGELAAPEVLDADPGLGWDVEVVRLILRAQGAGAHAFLAAGHPDAFRMTEADLEAIAPPLTRILNRYDATRAAAAMGDEAALVIGYGQYGIRSMRQRGQAIAEREAAETAPEIEAERAMADALLPRVPGA